MTTNSYGSSLPRFDFEPLRPLPIAARARIARVVPLTTGIYALPVLAVVGIAAYAQSLFAHSRRHQHHLHSSARSSTLAPSLQDSRHRHESFPRDHEFWENLEIACGVWT